MSMSKKPKILVFLPYYLPGYKSGGILRTVANTVSTLNNHFDFWIITRDRDQGDVKPYPNLDSNVWHNVDGAMVRYLPPETCNIKYLVKLIEETPHDIIHLNSFFDGVFTFKVLLSRRIGLLPNKFIIFSPRGELVEGCLRLKYIKKILFIQMVKFFRLYENIIWHASSEHEVLNFIKIMKFNENDIKIALDLPSKLSAAKSNIDLFSEKYLRIIFISRLTREKNLDYALQVLKNVKANIVFDIYGPNEDVKYWNECHELIKLLPSNIKTIYHGAVSPDMVPEIMSRYDLFFFPSRGENYGHVIAEALSAGTKVLISTNTPWLDLAVDELGWDVNLKDDSVFAKIIEELAADSLDDRLNKRVLVQQAASKRLFDSKVIDDNRKLFETKT